MSDAADPVESYLDDLSEYLDVQENAGGITQIREHYTIQIHKHVNVSEVPENGNIGWKLQSIPYSVGGIQKVKNAPAGCKFVCVQDSVTPVEHPSDICVRRQTWEAFGKFVDAPAEWNQ